MVSCALIPNTKGLFGFFYWYQGSNLQPRICRTGAYAAEPRHLCRPHLFHFEETGEGYIPYRVDTRGQTRQKCLAQHVA